MLAKVFRAPVIDRHPDHRAAKRVLCLESIQRTEGHLFRQIASDPEDHEDIGLMR
jgi:hypothetical protein